MSKAKFKVGDHVIYSNKNYNLLSREYKIIGTSHYNNNYWIGELVDKSLQRHYLESHRRINRSGSYTYINDHLNLDGRTTISHRCVEIPKKSKNLFSMYIEYDPKQQKDRDDDL